MSLAKFSIVKNMYLYVLNNYPFTSQKQPIPCVDYNIKYKFIYVYLTKMVMIAKNQVFIHEYEGKQWKNKLVKSFRRIQWKKHMIYMDDIALNLDDYSTFSLSDMQGNYYALDVDVFALNSKIILYKNKLPYLCQRYMDEYYEFMVFSDDICTNNRIEQYIDEYEATSEVSTIANNTNSKITSETLLTLPTITEEPLLTNVNENIGETLQQNNMLLTKYQTNTKNKKSANLSIAHTKFTIKSRVYNYKASETIISYQGKVMLTLTGSVKKIHCQFLLIGDDLYQYTSKNGFTCVDRGITAFEFFAGYVIVKPYNCEIKINNKIISKYGILYVFDDKLYFSSNIYNNGICSYSEGECLGKAMKEDSVVLHSSLKFQPKLLNTFIGFDGKKYTIDKVFGKVIIR